MKALYQLYLLHTVHHIKYRFELAALYEYMFVKKSEHFYSYFPVCRATKYNLSALS
jgi:hypothetical protein